MISLNRTKLGGLPEQQNGGLHRLWLPFWAVFRADLSISARSWMFRAWVLITTLLAFTVLIRQPVNDVISDSPLTSVIRSDWLPSAPHDVTVLHHMLLAYVMIGSTFIIMMTAGTISSELSMIADSVLSRGISRWQYVLGKIASRLVSIIGSYLVIAGATAAFLWWNAPPAMSDSVVQAGGQSLLFPVSHEGSSVIGLGLSVTGILWSICLVAAILTCVTGLGVAASACFDSSMLAASILWITTYGTGVACSLLDLDHYSLRALIFDIPYVIQGDYAWLPILKSIGAWLAVPVAASILSSATFARRDL